MKDVVGSTSGEVRMIKAIQRSVGALDNGWIGNQTLSDIAAKLGADCFRPMSSCTASPASSHGTLSLST